MGKVAVIGAGASGLTAIKCCLDEGLIPVCFERTDAIGGLWCYTEDVRDGQACVMKSTVINTSKEAMCYSDFPIPKEFPNFLHNKKVLQYFHMYSKRFGLEKHIKFNHEILRLEKSDDFGSSGKWKLEVRDKNTNREFEEVFDAVMVCTGHHAHPKMATFDGLDLFKGLVRHSHDYKHPGGFEDKRVVVVGVGNSGVDVATELGKLAGQVYLSTRRGTWVFSRTTDQGIPEDSKFLTRWLNTLYNYIPQYMEKQEIKTLNRKFNHALYGLQPKHGVGQAHGTVSDELPIRIASGSVVVKPNIRRLTETGVEFEDGTFEDNIDAVILCTGYVFGFPFINKSVINVRDNVLDLYKYIFPPDLEKSTLAVIGAVQPIGAIMPLSEIASRVATRVFKGECVLPGREEMWKDIENKRHQMSLRYVESTRHTIQVDFIPYHDELADMIGCKPRLWSWLFKNPRLWYKLFFGPCTPVQFRLDGPGKWDRAAETIMGTQDRIMYPFKTRKTGAQNTTADELSKLRKWIVCVLTIGVGVWYGLTAKQ